MSDSNQAIDTVKCNELIDLIKANLIIGSRESCLRAKGMYEALELFTESTAFHRGIASWRDLVTKNRPLNQHKEEFSLPSRDVVFLLKKLNISLVLLVSAGTALGRNNLTETALFYEIGKMQDNLEQLISSVQPSITFKFDNPVIESIERGAT